jgi:ubiquinone/menaquinone biosynthesis C-methylase UbiE
MQGNPDLWDEIWRSAPDANRILFTRDEPANYHQFVQRCYFEDLHSLIDENCEKRRFLELGSGRATTSMYLADKGLNVTLVDLSSHGLNLAISNFRSNNLAAPTCVITDVQKTGLKSESFDYIYNIGLLEHFIDPLPTLQESFRLLTKGGLLFSVIVGAMSRRKKYFLTLVYSPWKAPFSFAKGIMKYLIKRPKPNAGSDMIRTDYSCEKYIQWAEESGFREVKCIPYNPYQPIPATYISDISLRLYKRIHGLKNGPLKLKTLSCFSRAQLLVAKK